LTHCSSFRAVCVRDNGAKFDYAPRRPCDSGPRLVRFRGHDRGIAGRCAFIDPLRPYLPTARVCRRQGTIVPGARAIVIIPILFGTRCLSTPPYKHNTIIESVLIHLLLCRQTAAQNTREINRHRHGLRRAHAQCARHRSERAYSVSAVPLTNLSADRRSSYFILA